MLNRQLSISSERTIPLGAIKFVSTSKLKDDWFSLGVSSPQEPDPLINCVFKTEFFTHLKRIMPGGLNLKIAESIEYNKKPGKPSLVKVVKDSTVPRDDLYKSGTIHTGQGEPPNSVSRRTPKGKPKAGKPITQGKLLRPGGPGGGPSKLASRPAAARPVPQPMPSQPLQSGITPAQTSSVRPVPQPAAPQPRVVPQPLAAVNGFSHSRNDSAGRAQPPPPPAAPPAVKKDTYKALYEFSGQSQNELHHLAKDEIIEILQKADNGLFLPPTKSISYTNESPRLVARQKARRPLSRLGTLSIPHRRHPQTHSSAGSTSARRARRSRTAPLCLHQRHGLPRSSRKSETDASSAAETTRRRQETGTAARAPRQRREHGDKQWREREEHARQGGQQQGAEFGRGSGGGVEGEADEHAGPQRRG